MCPAKVTTPNAARTTLKIPVQHMQTASHTHIQTHIHSRWHTVRTRRPRRERTDCKIFVIILLSSCQAEIMSLFSDWHVPASQSVIRSVPQSLSLPACLPDCPGLACSCVHRSWQKKAATMVGCALSVHSQALFVVFARICLPYFTMYSCACAHTLCIEFRYTYSICQCGSARVFRGHSNQKSKFVGASMWLCDPCVSNK